MQLYKSRGIRGVFELTVIIPSHNKQRYIIDCLDSIYSQTLKVKEVIVFDDCSTDGTLNLLRHYQKTHNNLRIIESQTNVGVSKARDLAIRSAKTDYVTFIDADDYYFEKEKLEREMARAFNFYNETGIFPCTYSQTVLVDENGIRIDKKNIHDWDKNLRLGTIARLYRYWIPRDYCFPKAAYMDVGGFEDDLNLYEDWDLNLRLYAKYPFLFSGVYGTAYRLETGGLSSVDFSDHFEKKKYVFKKNKRTLNYSILETFCFYCSLYGTYIKNKIIRG